ncbi:hypothetical protein COU57_01515 [Candidatus Pacearchaeota archaeon CG10_big_fil_rev_8_21_14_0_10_32_14]|nr:MAG: hypothetical protein COU57_01515 [Candidatus Pacearchaeota archaeon CG10_big_fil_rev_8_21_14_0_10_32_14]
MVKKRVKASRKSPLRRSGRRSFDVETGKVVSSPRKIKSIAINLIVFAVLSLLLYILSIITTHPGLVNLFWIFSVMLMFVALAFFIVLLVFILLNYFRK